MADLIPFNKPLILGTEKAKLTEVFRSGLFSANGRFTAGCHRYLESELGYRKALLTTSCTAALELAAVLLQIGPKDEVIVPSYAFVTTANAFASRGAKIVFADSNSDSPAIDESSLEGLITTRTKAIVALHYAGVACNMDAIRSTAEKHGVRVIEDNAQGIGSQYKGQPLGGIGDFGAISFHDTKNVHCGEGGALLVNQNDMIDRASVIWDMGTNKADYLRGKVKSYGWVDVGSSFYPSELNAAFLSAQLEKLGQINEVRMKLWSRYHEQLTSLAEMGAIKIARIPDETKHNAHTFYIVAKSRVERDQLIAFLAEKGITATFHFQSLHGSEFFSAQYHGPELSNADRFSNCLVRLPLYHSLKEKEQGRVIRAVREFYLR